MQPQATHFYTTVTDVTQTVQADVDLTVIVLV